MTLEMADCTVIVLADAENSKPLTLVAASGVSRSFCSEGAIYLKK
jgi:hypothetical protein